MLGHAAGDPSYANQFWERFGYKLNFDTHNYSLAKQEIIYILHQCSDIDRDAYVKCHKGTPYYWLGTAAYLQNDYQTATFFFDAAVSEDLRIDAHPINNPTPAIYFLTLEGEQPLQAAQQLVQDAQEKVKRASDFYNGLVGKAPGISDLTVEEIRKKFLIPGLDQNKPGWRTLVSAFITYFIEWESRNEFYDIRPGGGTSEPFFLHLFKGCVLFESLLRINPKRTPKGHNLGGLLDNLSTELGIAPHPNIGGITFPELIANLESSDNRIETAILNSGRVRNTVGHDLGWVAPMDKVEYQQLYLMIASSCLHVINCLYP